MSADVTVHHPLRLSSDEVRSIHEIAQKATQLDGVAPLNEASDFALESLQADAHTPAGDGLSGDGRAPRVWLAKASATSGEESIVGVLVDAAGDASGADVVVAPEFRRQGIGRQLVAEFVSTATQSNEAPALWAHGDLTSAQALCASASFEPVRSLWKMSRPLAADETFDVALPDGFEAASFDGSEEQAQAWWEVNALAFAYHPEQGRMTLDDFWARTRESWFDPAGLILVWDRTADVPTLAASHWIKVESETVSGQRNGEVYVVAVAPNYQGRGLARPLTALGLRQLQAVGATTVDLYVEGDNDPAKATYFRAGFTQSAHDAMYRLATHGKSATAS